MTSSQYRNIPTLFFIKTSQLNKLILKAAIKAIRIAFGEKQVFAADNLITLRRNLGFIEEPNFRKAVDKNADPGELTIIWRSHVVCWAAKSCLSLPGDFVECGVYKGYTSSVVVDYTDFKSQPKKFYLYDLFEHVDDPGYGHSFPFLKPGLIDKVKDRFADTPNVKIVVGKVPEVFEVASPSQVAFMHIDMNNDIAERSALEGLWDRVVIGGMVIFDDYGWQAYRPQKVAIDDFFSTRNHEVVELPTGQGLVIKRF
jgi:O-methyltransferase